MNLNKIAINIYQVMFETFDVPSMHVSNHSLLTFKAYKLGASGVLIDAGTRDCDIILVNDGAIIQNAVQHLEIGGQDIGDLLAFQMRERGYNIVTRSERNIVRDIKEKLSYIALNFDEELSSSDIERTFTSPELAEPVVIGDARFRCAEILFTPCVGGKDSGMEGIHQLVWKAIRRCDESVRKDLYGNICLCGGTSLIGGFQQRMRRELEELAVVGTEINVGCVPDGVFTNWVAGSRMVSEMKSGFTTREEFEEYGPELVHKKMF